MTPRSVFLAAVALLCSPAGYAQNTTVDATVEAVANALGMVRGGQRRMDSINHRAVFRSGDDEHP